MHLDQQGNVKANTADKSTLAHFADPLHFTAPASELKIKMSEIDIKSLEFNLGKIKNLLSECVICEYKCLVDRIKGKAGKCGIPGEGYIYQSQLSYNEEPAISPTYEIYFAGCNMFCNYCHQEGYNRYNKKLQYLSLQDVIQDIMDQKSNIRSISYLGGNPDHSLSLIMSLIKRLNLTGIKLPQVFNSNFLFSKNIAKIINELFDVFIADFKFGNNMCAFNIADCIKYVDVVQNNILGLNSINPVFIRHMPLTSHYDCCTKPVLDWIADNNKKKSLHLSLLESLYSDNSLELNKAKKHAVYRKIETKL